MNTRQAQAGQAATQAEAGAGQCLTFRLAGEEYSVTVLRAQEIKGWDAVMPIPNAPDYLLGMINLRGVLVPIVNLRRRLGAKGAGFDPATVIVLIKVVGKDHERLVGVVVDAVSAGSGGEGEELVFDGSVCQLFPVLKLCDTPKPVQPGAFDGGVCQLLPAIKGQPH